MDPRLIERAAALLRDAPDHTLPLVRLHRALARPGGLTPPSAEVLAAALAADPAFVLAGAADPLHGVPLESDGRTRARYRAALGFAAADVWVSLCDPAGAAPSGALALLAASLRQIEGAMDVPGVADRIAEAHAEYGALARMVPPHAI